MLTQQFMFCPRQYRCRECGCPFLTVSFYLRQYTTEAYQAGDDWAQFNLFCSTHCLRAYNSYHEYLESQDLESEG